VSLPEQDALRLGALDAHDQAALVAGRQVTTRELAEAALTRIALVDGAVNAVTHTVAPDRLPEVRGTGPLAGVPYLLKASLEYPGWPVTSGSRARADAIGRTAYPFVQELDAAGLVPVGMSAMPEFGLLTGGEPMLTGPVRNPWSPGHSAGGSSTGAAAAVAAGLVPLAHASDAAGSIRVPAACCGVVGLKASRGGNLRARGPHLIDDLLCSDGLIGRSIRDVAWAFETVRDPAAPIAPERPVAGLRVALCLTGLDGVTAAPDVAAAVRLAATACAELGLAVGELPALPVNGPAVLDAFRTIWVHEAGEIVDLVAAGNPGVAIDGLLEPWTLGLAERRRSLRLADTAAALAQVEASAVALGALHHHYDVLLTPVTATPPPPLGVLAPTRDFDGLWEAFWGYTNVTPLANIAGVPAISLPLGSADGLPIGVMATAAADADRTLLALGRALEDAMPWRDRWPAASAQARLATRARR
jgi:amidase